MLQCFTYSFNPIVIYPAEQKAVGFIYFYALTQLALTDIHGPSRVLHKHSISTDFLQQSMTVLGMDQHKGFIVSGDKYYF